VHIATLKTCYGITTKLWESEDVETIDTEEWVPPPLDIRNLELQSSFFKITMISSTQAAMSLPMTKNPLPWLWPKLSSNVLISTKLLEFMKDVEIAHVQVLESVENERTFSSLLFLKEQVEEVAYNSSRLGGLHVCTIRFSCSSPSPNQIHTTQFVSH
jgi:hypothetical protein